MAIDAFFSECVTGSSAIGQVKERWLLLEGEADTVLTDSTSTRYIKYNDCKTFNQEIVYTSVFNYSSRKGLTPEQRSIAEYMLARGVETYISGIAGFKSVLPAEGATDDSVTFEHIRYLIDQITINLNAVKGVLPAACPLPT